MTKAVLVILFIAFVLNSGNAIDAGLEGNTGSTILYGAASLLCLVAGIFAYRSLRKAAR